MQNHVLFLAGKFPFYIRIKQPEKKNKSKWAPSIQFVTTHYITSLLLTVSLCCKLQHQWDLGQKGSKVHCDVRDLVRAETLGRTSQQQTRDGWELNEASRWSALTKLSPSGTGFLSGPVLCICRGGEDREPQFSAFCFSSAKILVGFSKFGTILYLTACILKPSFCLVTSSIDSFRYSEDPWFGLFF